MRMDGGANATGRNRSRQRHGRQRKGNARCENPGKNRAESAHVLEEVLDAYLSYYLLDTTTNQAL